MPQRQEEPKYPHFLRVSSVAILRPAWLLFAMGVGCTFLPDARGGETYAEAYAQSQEQGKPLLAFVGAAWCPACRTMKEATLPQLRTRHALDGFALALVDLDRDGEIGARLTDRGPVPQLILWRKTARGWTVRRLIGSQSVETIESFLKEQGARSGE
ncbi:MAG: thioredoxin family protein [Thermoguttaceae bacterium]